MTAGTMYWLEASHDFRGALRTAMEISHSRERLRNLSALASCQLGFLETIQLDRALGESAEGASDLAQVKLAVLASATVDHLTPGIRVGGVRHGLLMNVHVGGYGQYRQELLDASSTLHQFAPEVVLFSLTAHQAMAELPITATAAEVDEEIGRFVEDLRSLWRKAQDSFGSAVVQQTFLDVTDSLFGSFDRHVAASPSQFIAQLNSRVAEAASVDGVLLLDIARAGERAGRDAWFDRARWLQAKQEIAPHAAPMYGELLARVVAAQRGLSKKCLVLDLDNTLWHGVIGDDGLEGIVLGEGTA